MDFELLTQYGDRFWDGTLISLKLVLMSSILGLLIALPMALARSSHHRRYWIPAYSYIYFFRGTPLLIQLFIIYYGLGQFEAITNSFLWPVLSDAEWCGLIGMTLNTAAYTAEILRGGIRAVPRGEIEAAKAYGMSWWLLQRRIVLPRALRIAWPAYGNEVILLLKGSALVSTIAVWDLMGETRSIFSRTYALEIFVYAAIIYFLLTFLLTRVFNQIEKRINRYLVSY
ncbi:MAG: ABC transporter permease [Gammaproteobacteria bacterium]|nr:ABC transporter permease [Gammaproteobacteria bacterium]